MVWCLGTERTLPFPRDFDYEDVKYMEPSQHRIQ